jgi:hypothetical protein
MNAYRSSWASSLLAAVLLAGCAQSAAEPESPDGAAATDATVDAGTAPDGSADAGGPEASSPSDASPPPHDAASDAAAAVDSGNDAGPLPTDAGAPDAHDPAADCLLAGSPPDGGDPASNAYMQSCGGDPAGMTTAQNGSPCTISVLGQHCFLQCAFCKSAGGSPPSNLLLPCTQPINNCCGVLTCGGCGTCN